MVAVSALRLLPTLIYYNFMVPSSLRVSSLVLSHYDSPGIKVFYYLCCEDGPESLNSEVAETELKLVFNSDFVAFVLTSKGPGRAGVLAGSGNAFLLTTLLRISLPSSQASRMMPHCLGPRWVWLKPDCPRQGTGPRAEVVTVATRRQLSSHCLVLSSRAPCPKMCCVISHISPQGKNPIMKLLWATLYVAFPFRGSQGTLAHRRHLEVLG